MGQSVLRYQFVAGLRANLRAKVIGCTGPFDELLSKASFEEARLREVVEDRPRPRDGPGREEATGKQTSQGARRGNTLGKTENACYTCGVFGHYARDCSQRRRVLPVESQGWRPKNSKVDNVQLVQPEIEEQTSTIGPSHHQGSNHAVDTAVQEVVATMHGIKPQPTGPSAELGPTLTREVLLDDVPVQALLDTGSPVSIVSLDFFIKAAANSRDPSQPPSDWGDSTRKRIQQTTLTLRGYGGDRLAIVGQVSCKLSQG